ncbi:hypothetical protein [Pseudomonas putida]|uniref:hypothetical protein n=1 Tax=Pseudomonas putida TaxID=303 RepID=UPI000F4B3179|nr:hypothetical protein [Pseudomonas putida]
MEKLRIIVTRAMKSIDRITNALVALFTKMLSVMGITRAITRMAAKAIRKERLMLASIAFLSPSLFLLLVAMLMLASKGEVLLYARAVVVGAGGAVTVYFAYRRLRRRHQTHVSRRERLARERRKHPASQVQT